ncbi:MAG: hypothetical protein FJ028_02295 [Chloroflexi bacterium]|nr:hypothetical protein [Chloroflexota bacterium]
MGEVLGVPDPRAVLSQDPRRLRREDRARPRGHVRAELGLERAKQRRLPHGRAVALEHELSSGKPRREVCCPDPWSAQPHRAGEVAYGALDLRWSLPVDE